MPPPSPTVLALISVRFLILTMAGAAQLMLKMREALFASTVIVLVSVDASMVTPRSIVGNSPDVSVMVCDPKL